MRLPIGRSVDRRAVFRAQRHAAAGGSSLSGREEEQGAESQAAGTGVNNQVQVQILHHFPGGQGRSAGRTTGHRNQVSGGEYEKLLLRSEEGKQRLEPSEPSRPFHCAAAYVSK